MLNDTTETVDNDNSCISCSTSYSFFMELLTVKVKYVLSDYSASSWYSSALTTCPLVCSVILEDIFCTEDDEGEAQESLYFYLYLYCN